MTVQDMLDVLKEVGGEDALKLVEEKRNEETERIVVSWPTRLDTTRARQLGFKGDGSLIETVRDYMQEYGKKEM